MKVFIVRFTEDEAHAVGYALMTTARRLRAQSPLDKLLKIPRDEHSMKLASRCEAAYIALDAGVEKV